MQSTLSDSFNRSQKPSQPSKNQQPSQQQQQQLNRQQQQSKRQQEQQQQQNQSQNLLKSKIQQEEEKRKQDSVSEEELEPMKDAFQSDESYLIVTQDIKDQKMIIDGGNSNNNNLDQNNNINGIKNIGNNNTQCDSATSIANGKNKKIVKKRKQYQWKNMWVRQENAVKGSKPIWIKKYVRVMIDYENDEVVEENNKNQFLDNGMAIENGINHHKVDKNAMSINVKN